MPAVAAHYMFGQLVAEKLNKDIYDLITSHKELFDIGTQGPDLLFYYNPVKKNPVSTYGNTIHQVIAKDFFEPICAKQPKIGQASLAYLLGAVSHYCLDLACHPYIIELSGDSAAHHRSLESDFDAKIIGEYAMSKKRFTCIPKRIDYEAVATVYALQTEDIRQCVNLMRGYTRLLDFSTFIKYAERVIGKKGMFSSLSLKSKPIFCDETKKLLTLFKDAVSVTAETVAKVHQCVTENTPFPDGFLYTFEGRG